MKKQSVSFRALLLLMCFSGLIQTVYTQSFVHPGVPFTWDDLNQLKENIRQEPWKSGYEALAADYRSQLGYGMQGPRKVVGRAPDTNRNPWMNDMIAVHNLAFMWIFTGEEAYARKGAAILNEWAVTNTTWNGDESFLDLGDHAPYFITGADILRSTWDGWTDEYDTNVDNYFRNVIWPETDVPNPSRGQNQGALQLRVAVGIAAYLGDRELWEQAIDVFRSDAGGGLANSLPNGQVGDTGRDEGHWFGQADALSWACEVAWKQGVDLYSELDNRMLAISELYTRYMVDNTQDTYIPHGGTYGYYTGFGTSGGARRQSLMYNIVTAAYKLRKNIDAPYTEAFRSNYGISESSISFLYRKSEDKSTATRLPEITFPNPVSVSNLTSIDIGNTGLTGSTEYSNGIWTIKAAGKDLPVPAKDEADGFRFVFKPVTGDAVIITNFDSVGTLQEARAGLMFRKSLDDDSRFAGIYLQPNGEIDFTFRDSKGWSKTATSWNIPPGGYLQHWGANPRWIKMERRDNKIAGYHSHDGIHWTCLGIAAFDNLEEELYVGMAVSSRNTSTLNESRFKDLQISQTSATGSPEITSILYASAQSGLSFSYTITAGNNPSGYSATGLPEGLSVNGSMITGTTSAQGRYIVRLSATNNRGTDTAILILDVTSNVAPVVPTGLSASITGTEQVTLTWDEVENASSYSIFRALSRNGEYEEIISGVNSNQFTDEEAFPGVNYYKVTAYAGSLEGGTTDPVQIILPPRIPQQPVITSYTDRLEITWSEALGATAYHVKRSTVSGGPYTTIQSSVTDTAYTDTNVTTGEYYYYVISSVLEDQESEDSEEELGVPGATFSVWNPNAVSGDWSNSSNWVNGVVPVSPAFITFNTSVSETLNNNVVGLEVARLTFSADASVTIDGNEIVLGNSITNNSTASQTIDLPVRINNEVEINVNSGNITINGIISGDGTLIRRGTASLTLTGANTYSGGTVVHDSEGGWPVHAPLNITGESNINGVSGEIISGPVGTGRITLSGGALRNSGYANIHNDIYVTGDTRNFLYSDGGGFYYNGSLKGNGTLEHDGNSYDGLHFGGDNESFEGRIVSILRSSWCRFRFPAAISGSSKAIWELNSNFSDVHRFSDISGPYKFGALEGTGLLNGYNDTELEIGALGLDSEFSGTSNSASMRITKVGNGTQIFSGIMSHYGTTTVKEGFLQIDGDYNSPVQVSGGTVGGVGETTAPITILSGGKLTAGSPDGIGTFTVLNTVTFKSGAVFEPKVKDEVSDILIANGITIETGTTLSIKNLGEEIPEGVSYLIAENAGDSPVDGTFEGLDDFDFLLVDGVQFYITYRGGDGNDIEIYDNRNAVAVIKSHLEKDGTKGISFTYQIEAINNPTAFDATGLPGGLQLNPSTGEITGIPTESGIFNVVLTTTNTNGEYKANLLLTIMTDEVPAAPGTLTFTEELTQLTIAWPFVQADFPEYYTLQRSDDNQNFNIIAEEIIDTFYVDKGLRQNTTYYYKLSATNSIGESTYSQSFEATTLQPENRPAKVVDVKSVGGLSQVYLAWNAPFEAETYIVERSTSSEGTFSQVYEGFDLFYTDHDVTNGVTYYYRILSSNMLGNSDDYSSLVKVTPVEYAKYYWAMDEGNGSTITDSWSGEVAEIKDQVTWATGIHHNALNMNGAANSYVQLPDNMTEDLEDFTVSIWVNMNSISNWMRIFDFGSGTTRHMFLTASTGSQIRYVITVNGNASGAEQQINYNSSLPIGSWTHVAVTQQGSTGIMYVNGIEVARNESMTLFPKDLGATNQNYLGKAQYNDPILNGIVDDLRIYSQALTQEEIMDVFLFGAPPAPRNLTAGLDEEGKVILAWDEQEGYTNYRVRRTSSSGSSYTILYSSVQGNSYVDQTAAYGTYYYVVTALGENIESAYSNEASVTLSPDSPKEPLVLAWNDKIDLSWKAAEGATSYKVKRASEQNGSYTEIGTTTETFYSDNNQGEDFAAGIYYYVISALNERGESLDSEEISISIADRYGFDGWKHQDIGSNGPSITGNAGFRDSKFTMYASGDDIWYSSDQFHFAYKEIEGDMIIVANISELSNTHASAKGGVMIRETLDPAARFVSSNFMPGGGIEFSRRASNGATPEQVTAPAVEFPHWLKLVREGDDFTMYYSDDALSGWTQIQSDTRDSWSLSMAGPVYVGGIACSHNNSQLIQSVFGALSVATAEPVVLTGQIANGGYGNKFYYSIQATEMPYYYRIAEGLPAGLALDEYSGVITGIPEEIGTFTVEIEVTNGYGSATGSITLDIAKGDQTIDFPALPVKSDSDDDFDPGAVASSGLPVEYSSSDESVAIIIDGKVRIRSRGECIIYANQPGNEYYNAAPQVSRELVVSGIATGMEEVKYIDGWDVYPTLVRGQITLAFGRDIEKEKIVRIMDMNGRIILIRKTSGEDMINMDLSALSAGVYFISVDIFAPNTVKKIIKQ